MRAFRDFLQNKQVAAEAIELKTERKISLKTFQLMNPATVSSGSSLTSNKKN